MTWVPVKARREPVYYTVSWNPKDSEKKFVVRRVVIENDTLVPGQECQVFHSLASARKSLPKECIKEGVDKHEDKTIVEVWI